MWLFSSSIGRKVVMSLTGMALVLFLTFHMSMNLVALFSQDAYNAVCKFLGANWYALVASMGLAFLTLLHIVYAFWLTYQNRKARGTSRYKINSRPKGVKWASQNMLVLGFIIVIGIALHLFNFWAKMQLAELMGVHDLGIEGVSGPTDGAGLIAYTFKNPIYVTLYLLWFVAIWLHINHGFWSAFQTLGLNNNKWMNRLRVFSFVYSTLIILGFAAVTLFYFVNSLLEGAISLNF